ncbi:TPA: hypothetical protein L9M72_004259 [Klebsiella quasipneumoniae subsp. quasipneumoniae]|nr:hypothetical protein [Klebsiella quasipneumoniae subsp. quasipneumoniae]HBR2081795.1 hypothetical protein [Klebsiella quasipneumoniae subsp. quasipneumoniae]
MMRTCRRLSLAARQDIRPWAFSYRVKFAGVAEISEEHPSKRQLQATLVKAPEITPFMS